MINEFGNKSVRNKFSELIGEDRLITILNDNWVRFEQSGNKIEMNFFIRDGKGDKVIFCSICYQTDTGMWWSENCIDSPEVEFATYEEMRDHLNNLEDRIMDNGFDIIELP